MVAAAGDEGARAVALCSSLTLAFLTLNLKFKLMSLGPQLTFCLVTFLTMTSITDALAPYKRDGYFVIKIIDYKEVDFPAIVGAITNYYDFLVVRTLDTTTHLPYNKTYNTKFSPIVAKLKDPDNTTALELHDLLPVEQHGCALLHQRSGLLRLRRQLQGCLYQTLSRRRCDYV